MRSHSAASLFAKIVVVTVVTTVCLEVTARLSGVRSGWLDPRLYAPNPITVYATRPAFQGDFAGAWVSINSEGLRGGEVPAQKQPQELRVLILGDSVAFGQGVPQDEVFAARLEALLETDGTRRTYRVINAGVPGFNTVNERDYLVHAGEHLQPDAIIVLYVDNDADPQLFVGFTDQGVPMTAEGAFTRQDWMGRASAFLYRHSSLYTFIRRVLLMARVARTVGGGDAAVYNERARERFSDANPGLLASTNALMDMQRWSQTHRVPLMVAVFSRFPAGSADAYRDAVVAFCEHAQIPVVAIPMISAGERPQDFVIPWDGHPNTRAHGRIAEHLHAALVPLLRTASGPGQ